jgi:uncharacterized cupin superfamily protein
MQSFAIGDGIYPDVVGLQVRTSTGTQIGEVASPRDLDVVHTTVDFPVRWLRERAPGYQGTPLASGLLLMEPSINDFTFVGDETILLVSGVADVADDEGNVVHLRGGDTAYFAAGTPTTWTVHEEAVELFTILG